MRVYPLKAEPDVRGGGDSGGPGDMEIRVKAIEDAMIAVKTDLAVIKSNYATKTDIAETKIGIAEAKAGIAEAKSSIIMWVVSAVLLAQVLPSVLKKFGL
jgi:ABC-type metal ion transport system substrate-binding protein